MAILPQYAVSSREYAVVEALWFTLLRRVHLSKALSHREKNYYQDKLQAALRPVDNAVKLERLNALQAELDGGQA